MYTEPPSSRLNKSDANNSNSNNNDGLNNDTNNNGNLGNINITIDDLSDMDNMDRESSFDPPSVEVENDYKFESMPSILGRSGFDQSVSRARSAG